MCNRKRHTARPTLEQMETLVMPSVVGILAHAHHAKAVSAHVRRVSDGVKQADTSEHDNNEALMSLRQQQNLVQVHAHEKTPSAIPTAAEKAASAIPDFFKSLGSAL
jgi:hypothetical protein